MHINLSIKRLQKAANSKSMQDVKTIRVGSQIEIDARANRNGKPVHSEPLMISVRKATEEESQDRRRNLTDAKKIHAWLLWNTPAGTYKWLWKIMSTEDHSDTF